MCLFSYWSVLKVFGFTSLSLMDGHEYKEVEPVGVQELEDAEKNSVDSDEDDE